ncbi:MAG: hypothetical protein IJX38_04170 [Clostridia bacterium]|nr:hypothetical protein [Clostridia bacterium]
MIVSFCGHSRFRLTLEYECKILEYLQKIIKDEPMELLLGGYGAFDEFAYMCCNKFKQLHANVSLVLVTPYMSVEYQKSKLAKEKTRYDSIVYPEIENKPLRFAITYRNRYMVDCSDYVIAYVDHTWGGAYSTYKYAVRKNKTVLNLTEIKEDNKVKSERNSN